MTISLSLSLSLSLHIECGGWGFFCWGLGGGFLQGWGMIGMVVFYELGMCGDGWVDGLKEVVGVKCLGLWVSGGWIEVWGDGLVV